MILYDLELSRFHRTGQVLRYAFWELDHDLNGIDEMAGSVRLNRTEMPSLSAIIRQSLDLDQLQSEGETEYEAAHRIFHFIKQKVVNSASPIQLFCYGTQKHSPHALFSL